MAGPVQQGRSLWTLKERQEAALDGAGFVGTVTVVTEVNVMVVGAAICDMDVMPGTQHFAAEADETGQRHPAEQEA